MYKSLYNQKLQLSGVEYIHALTQDWFILTKQILDTRDLTISGVWDDATNEKLTFDLQEPKPAVGAGLEIQLPSNAQQK